MDGITRQHGRGSVLPRYSNYFWNRYSRKKRAAIRHLLFWVTFGIVYGALVDWGATRYALLAVTPFILSRIVIKAVNLLTQEVKFTDSDGVTDSYRIMRPRVMAQIKKLKPPRIRLGLPDNGPVPQNLERAIMADNAEDHGEPIMSMRLAKEIQEAESDTRAGANAHKRYRRNSPRVGRT